VDFQPECVPGLVRRFERGETLPVFACRRVSSKAASPNFDWLDKSGTSISNEPSGAGAAFATGMDSTIPSAMPKNSCVHSARYTA